MTAACDCPAGRIGWHTHANHRADCPDRTCRACWGCMAAFAIRQAVRDSRRPA